jgi:hypothetical protein
VRSTVPQLTGEQYRTAIQQIQSSDTARQVDQLFFSLAAGDVSPRECRDGARRFAEDIHAIIHDVERLAPPDDAVLPQQRLVESAKESAAKLDALADDVEAGAVTCGRQWNERAYGLPSTDRADEAFVELSNLGYVYIGQ